MNGASENMAYHPVRGISSKFIGFIGLSIAIHGLFFMVKSSPVLQPEPVAIGNHVLSVSLENRENKLSVETTSNDIARPVLKNKKLPSTNRDRVPDNLVLSTGKQVLQVANTDTGNNSDNIKNNKPKTLSNPMFKSVEENISDAAIKKTSNREADEDSDESQQRNYLLGEIQHRIKQFLDYPDRARRRGWEGSVMVGFAVDKQGFLQNIHLTRTSGYELLDTAALTAVKKARYVPVSHWGSSFQPVVLQLPIIYQLGKS